MNDYSFLDNILFDNTIRSYLIVLAVISAAFIVKRIVSKFCAGMLYRMVGKAGKSIDKNSFFDLVIHPLELFILLFIAFVAIDKLTFPKDLEFHIFKFSSRKIIDSISNGLLVISFIWLCIRLIDFTALVLEDKANVSKNLNENQLIIFFKDFFKVIIVIIGVLLILKFSFNTNIGNLFTGLSIVGAAIALALRESLENLIASFVIFFDKPFATGDTVKVQQFTGVIEKIGLRSTRIRTENKTFITVPNKQMVDSIIDNISLRTQRRIEIKLELNIDSTATQLKTLINSIQQFLNQEKFIINHQVFLSDIGKNFHTITADIYTPLIQSVEEFNEFREAINMQLISLVNETQLKFANLDSHK